MFLKFLSLIALVAATTVSAETVSYKFDGPDTLDEEWPNREEFRTGSSISVLDSPERVSLFADTGGGAHAFAAISTASSTELDFLADTVTFTFTDVTFGFGAGKYYVGALGVTNADDPDIYSNRSVSEAVFLLLNRPTNELQVVQKKGQKKIILATFPAMGFMYETLSLTLTGTTWSVSGTTVTSETISGNGDLDAAITTTRWGSNFHIGLQARSNFRKAIAGRFATLEVGEVSCHSHTQ